MWPSLSLLFPALFMRMSMADDTPTVVVVAPAADETPAAPAESVAEVVAVATNLAETMARSSDDSNAIFSAILDLRNELLGRFDGFQEQLSGVALSVATVSSQLDAQDLAEEIAEEIEEVAEVLDAEVVEAPPAEPVPADTPPLAPEKRQRKWL